MAKKADLIHKLDAVTGGKRLELTVTKTLGPVATSADVASTGHDNKHFLDSDLTPGPAVKALNPNNSYSILWHGAFVENGSVTLTVRVLDSQGAELTARVVTVHGEKGNVFFRLVVVP